MSNFFSRKKTVKERSLDGSESSSKSPNMLNVFGIPTSRSREKISVIAGSGTAIPASVSREKISLLTGSGKELPSEEVMNAQFESLLVEMGLPIAKMDQMRLMPIDKKWMLVQQHQAKLGSVEAPSPSRGPQAFVDILNSGVQGADVARELQSLEVALRTEPITWVQEFVKVGGLDALIQQLQKLLVKQNPTQIERDCQLYCVRAMKAQLNNTFGLQATIGHPEGVRSLALGLGCQSLRIQTLTVEVLAAVCFVPPQGHTLILDALEAVKKAGTSRFQGLVDILNGEKEVSAQYLEYQISCMTFINAIVNSPEDLAFRLTLRNEFMELAIGDVLPILRDINSEELNTQLSIFEEEGAYDFELMAERLQTDDVNFRDVEEMFGTLRDRLDDTECSGYLLSIVQSLALLPLDKARRKRYWELTSEVVKQISLQRNGMNPDISRLQLNVSLFIDAAVGVMGANAAAVTGRASASKRSSRSAKRVSLKSGELLEANARVRELEALLRERSGEVEEVKRLRKEVGELNARIGELVEGRKSQGNNASSNEASEAPAESRKGFNNLLAKAFKGHAKQSSQDSSPSSKAPADNASISNKSGSPDKILRAALRAVPPPPPLKPAIAKAKRQEAKESTNDVQPNESASAIVTASAESLPPPPPPPPPPPMMSKNVPPPPPPPAVAKGAPPPPPAGRKMSIKAALLKRKESQHGSVAAIPEAPAPPPMPVSAGLPPPPPPPPPGMGGPPPPPPPPGAQRPGGVPPPPPPPGGAPADHAPILPAKQKVVPNVKMKPLAWNKIAPQQVGTTLWKQLAEKRDGEERLRKEKVDVRELEELFGVGGAVSPVKAEEEGVTSPLPSTFSLDKISSVAAAGPTKKQVVTLIDGKRSNNCCIMLGRIKHKFSEIRTAVLSVNETILTENIVKQFVAFIPTDEEIGLIKDYVEDGSGNSAERLNSLGKAEQFFYEMSKIPRYQNRLNAIYFKHRFAERLEELKPNIVTLLNGSRQIKESKKLSKLLELILVIGNYMNGDSFRGGAYGFSIDTLTKLSDTKTSTGKTFTYYLASLIEKKAPECKDILSDLTQLEKASKISLQQINQDIAELVKGFRDLESEIKFQQQAPAQAGDRFVDVFSSFVQQHREHFLEVQGKKSDAETSFKAAVEFFGEETKTATPESFFSIFWRFVSDLERSRKEFERDAEVQRKAAERADKKKSDVLKSASVDALAEEKDSIANSKKFSRSQDILNSDRKGVMDDLISSLKTGEMYRAKLKHRSVNPNASLHGSSRTAFEGESQELSQ
ncbi:hypothetical protein HDU97_004491 [Phlyctochytrium planicorne]|nr:hypothetical protein HDU97_004491 [Phlyctochytrium planicorne]